MKKVKLTVSMVLLVLLIIPLFFSFIEIINWISDNNKTRETLKSIEKSTEVEEVDDTIYTNVITESKNNEEKFLQVEFSDLLALNNDVKGWINIPGTDVDYPFVQEKDNAYYLTHSFDKSWNDAGWIFLDYRNNIYDLDTNTIIYGHGRLDGTMFGSLHQTLSQEWFLTQEKHIIKISSPAYNYIFEIFSIYKIKTTDDYLYNNFKTEEEYINFLEKVTNRSVHNFNVEKTSKDKILTLSTCYNNREKLVIHAKLIKQQKRY